MKTYTLNEVNNIQKELNLLFSSSAHNWESYNDKRINENIYEKRNKQTDEKINEKMKEFPMIKTQYAGLYPTFHVGQYTFYDLASTFNHIFLLQTRE